MVVRGRKIPVGRIGLALLVLNEIRGLAVVAGVLWAWNPWG